MSKSGFLGEFEQMVLLAILQLGADAYAPDVSARLEASASRRVSRGSLYSTLDRLERKGLVEWKIEAASPQRGGYRKRRFAVTAPGVHALQQSRQALMTLWNGLDDVLAKNP